MGMSVWVEGVTEVHGKEPQLPAVVRIPAQSHSGGEGRNVVDVQIADIPKGVTLLRFVMAW